MKIKLFLIGLIFSQLALAQQDIPLYEEIPKGSEDWDWSEAVNEQNAWETKVIYNVVKPTITPYLPPDYLATGTAVIIAPGGGFHGLCVTKEGADAAKWLANQGIAAFVLKHRLARSFTNNPVKEMYEKGTSILDDARKVSPLAMEDGFAAVKYVREHAKEFGINPDKVGFAGFSAGGALALNVAINAKPENRPNFIAPVYPWDVGVIGLKVPQDTIPMFMAVALDDPLGLAAHSINIYQKWTTAGQPAELHIYQTGGHGFGMLTKNLPTDTWIERFGDWLRVQGYMDKLYPEQFEEHIEKETALAKQLETNFAQLERYKSKNMAIKPMKTAESRVVFLGNSITEGWVHVDSVFFADNNFVGRGIGGQTSPQLLLRFRQDVIDLQPKAVVIHIGTNDVAENTGPFDPKFTMSNIQSMVELAKAHNIKVILTAVVPTTIFEWRRELGDCSEKIIDLNNRIKGLAEKENIVYVDYHTALKNEKNGMNRDLAADGVHPTAKGYAVMKALVLAAINEVLDE